MDRTAQYLEHIKTIPDRLLMWMINDQEGPAFKTAQRKMPTATHAWLLGELIDTAYERNLIDTDDYYARRIAEGF